MKNAMWTILVIIIAGILSASVYNLQAKENEIAYDDDQEGLNEQIVIKFSHVVAENTPKGLAAQKFADLVQEKTNNRVKVEVFPNGMLYSDEEELEALKEGDIQMIAPATSKLSSVVPELQIIDLPYAFPTYEAVNEALNGEIGTTLLSKMKQKNLVGLSFWSNGFKQVSSNRNPLIEPDDFKGQTFRIMPSEVIESQFQALDASTSRVPFNLTYRNLEYGRLNGQENTLSNIYSKKFFEVQKYMTISNHGFLGYVLLMDKNFWEDIPEDIQEDITEAMEEATKWNQHYAVIMNKSALDKIEETSDIKVYHLTPGEKERWMNEFESVYRKFEPLIGKDLMNKLESVRNKYRLNSE
ncbi:DctP family TRAP transporter solute-binding subunit [Pseudalkalibacillus caeni]|uniref:DctP family TRAP transporter solute-binding subunit n=1 Tax=Exobacillus caeni TaxID=2574798 RepID=A0A5R9F2P4_9BACL|nr:DctP family TRAP transporter solute-binding subunit [Pseudalkalibacillus caeni]TLS36576.1 DctP family TRAP transporter solute-binding subunit [Pseudalkalibacillus caeni]